MGRTREEIRETVYIVVFLCVVAGVLLLWGRSLGLNTLYILCPIFAFLIVIWGLATRTGLGPLGVNDPKKQGRGVYIWLPTLLLLGALASLIYTVVDLWFGK